MMHLFVKSSHRPGGCGTASYFYFDHQFQKNAVKVLPGEYFVANDSMVIMTVLGSCIAACVWDGVAHVGGMNHFMLPQDVHGDDSPDVAGRYGAWAMERLINTMMKQGARRAHMQAKIFGGAQVMNVFTAFNVGERNTRFVQEWLNTEGIPLVSADVLDTCARKVVFFPAVGKAMVKRLAHIHPVDGMAQEIGDGNIAVVARLANGGAIDLF